MTSGPEPYRLLAAGISGSAMAAVGFSMPAYAWTAVGVGLGFSLIILIVSIWRPGHWPLAVASSLPALALITFPGAPLSLAAWSLVGLVLAGALLLAANTPDPQWLDEIQRLRNDLHDHDAQRLTLHHHLQRYPVLLQTCLEMSTTREVDQLATLLAGHARRLAPSALRVAVYVGHDHDLRCRSSLDAHGNQVADRPFADEERFVHHEARPLLRREGSIVQLWVPLRGDRRRISADERNASGAAQRGVLFLEFSHAGLDNRLILEMTLAVGRLGGLGLATVALMDEARALALHDDLTGLYGQHEFLRRLEEQVAQARRHGLTLGVVMCDMDHLKAYNDSYGHVAGDEALRAVAAAMKATLASDVILCRYGGEEFGALLPESDDEATAQAANALHQAIRNATVSSEDNARRITATLGFSLLQPNESASDFLSRADAACYKGKKAGRDRVVAAEDLSQSTLAEAINVRALQRAKGPTAPGAPFSGMRPISRVSAAPPTAANTFAPQRSVIDDNAALTPNALTPNANQPPAPGAQA